MKEKSIARTLVAEMPLELLPRSQVVFRMLLDLDLAFSLGFLTGDSAFGSAVLLYRDLPHVAVVLGTLVA